MSTISRLPRSATAPWRKDGDINKAFGDAKTRIDAVYQQPFLAHATMELVNCCICRRSHPRRRDDVRVQGRNDQLEEGAPSLCAIRGGGRPHVFFDLDDGRVIDGAQGGRSARWVNHRCEPNCAAEQQGSRVYFYALRDIEPGEESFIDYRRFVQGRKTPALKKLYACQCASESCRGTMLAL
jgi:hypothetical protein